MSEVSEVKPRVRYENYPLSVFYIFLWGGG